jgi:hypothetical protein
MFLSFFAVPSALAWVIGDDKASALVAAAIVGWLPPQRRDWGRAMAAELAHVHGRLNRWRFAAGMLRVTLVLVARHRGRMLLAACGGGLVVTAAGTAAAAASAPGMAAFAMSLGILLTGGVALAVARQWRPALPQLACGLGALAGITGSVIAVARIAAAYPSTVADPTHVGSVLFASALAGYLVLAPVLAGRGQPAAVLWWGLAGALASGAFWIIEAVVMPVAADGGEGWFWPVGAATALAAAAGAAATAGSRRAGFRAGLLTVIFCALLHFTISLTALLHLGHYPLTDPYDIARYPHSGYPDTASYLLSDDIGGDIYGGLALYPISWLFTAALGAAVGIDLRKFTARRHTQPRA